jgi:hypothetical protein
MAIDLPNVFNGEWLDAQDFSNVIEARELVESGCCSGTCLVAFPAGLDSCTCVCGGRYHGALASYLVEVADQEWNIPRYDCVSCGKVIPIKDPHFLTESNSVCCRKCLFDDSSSKKAHAAAYPDCLIKWHDMWDHRHIECSHSAVGWSLRNGNPLTGSNAGQNEASGR